MTTGDGVRAWELQEAVGPIVLVTGTSKLVSGSLLPRGRAVNTYRHLLSLTRDQSHGI